jgi:DNA-binding LytR/AlgR family response regulator
MAAFATGSGFDGCGPRGDGPRQGSRDAARGHGSASTVAKASDKRRVVRAPDDRQPDVILEIARLDASVHRLRKLVGVATVKLEGLLARSGNASARPAFLRWIVASHGDEIELVTTDEVRFFKSDRKYTRAATAERDLLIRKTIKELKAELDPSVFWQVHRSTIVNMNDVANVSHGVNGGLVLHLSDRSEILQVSQPYAHLFHQM